MSIANKSDLHKADLALLLWRLKVIQLKIGNAYTQPKIRGSMILHHLTLVGGTVWYI